MFESLHCERLLLVPISPAQRAFSLLYVGHPCHPPTKSANLQVSAVLATINNPCKESFLTPSMYSPFQVPQESPCPQITNPHFPNGLLIPSVLTPKQATQAHFPLSIFSLSLSLDPFFRPLISPNIQTPMFLCKQFPLSFPVSVCPHRAPPSFSHIHVTFFPNSDLSLLFPLLAPPL